MASSMPLMKGQKPIPCQLCEINTTIKVKCLDCDLLLCKNCKEKVHIKFKNAGQHKIVDIKDISSHEEEMDFSSLKCEEHSAVCCLFCTSCDQLICPTCVSKTHKKHDLIEISEGYQIKVELIQKENSKHEMKDAKIKMLIDEGKKYKIRQHKKLQEEKKKILDQRDTWKKAVDQYADNLVQQLERRERDDSKDADDILKSLERVHQEIKDSISKFKDLRNTRDSMKFFQTMATLSLKDISFPPTQLQNQPVPTFVPGEITQVSFGELKECEQQQTSPYITLKVQKQYTTELTVITHICHCDDGSLWINSYEDKVLQHIQPTTTNIKVMTRSNAVIYGIALNQDKQIILSIEGKSILQQLNPETGQMTDSLYDVSPMLPVPVHVTTQGNVIGAAMKERRRAIIVIDSKGNIIQTCEHDINNKPIFILPRSITSTRDGYIHVVDFDPDDDKPGRVMVLTSQGDINNIYTGHPDINKDISFIPSGIVTTPRDNVIVADIDTHHLHILTNTGDLLSVYNTGDIGIEIPFSISFNSTGSLWIGCSEPKLKTREAKLYLVSLSGC